VRRERFEKININLKILVKKKLVLILSFFFFTGIANSQVFEWVRNEPVNYSFNPSYPEFPVIYDENNDRVINARLQNFSLIYSQSVLGASMLESRDTNGIMQWQLA